ncbi:hypothetical protein GQ55_5G284000 [Panicum hallii var. hallii]|uniref:Uncharacterized protein n=1 Tax=Panicum hallii var. hallii TaxID=1504633 RepID=A0A2T7DL34_9POAL|nr:hypothetical protein GQ55_5G284000 [Panicum hallii var. hallii]
MGARAAGDETGGRGGLRQLQETGASPARVAGGSRRPGMSASAWPGGTASPDGAALRQS